MRQKDQSQFDFLIFGKGRESLNEPTCARQLGGYSRTYPRGCSQREITRSRARYEPTGATRPRVRYRALERVISRREQPLGLSTYSKICIRGERLPLDTIA